MRRSKTASASSLNITKNSAYKINNQRPDKQIVPGTYTLHPPSKCKKVINGRSIHLKREKHTDRNEVLKIVSQENVGDLLLPLPPDAHPSIIPAEQIQRMRTAGNEFSKKQRLARVQEYEENKKRLEEECEHRNMLMKEMDRMKEEKRKSTHVFPNIVVFRATPLNLMS